MNPLRLGMMAACLTAMGSLAAMWLHPGGPAMAAETRPASAPSPQALYERECGICHQQGGTGTMMLARRLGEDRALLTQRDNLTPAYIAMAVRQGVNSMPTITRVELPDEELAGIIHYLTGKEWSPAEDTGTFAGQARR